MGARGGGAIGHFHRGIDVDATGGDACECDLRNRHSTADECSEPLPEALLRGCVEGADVAAQTEADED